MVSLLHGSQGWRWVVPLVESHVGRLGPMKAHPHIWDRALVQIRRRHALARTAHTWWESALISLKERKTTYIVRKDAHKHIEEAHTCGGAKDL